MQHQITFHPQAGLPGVPDDTGSVAGAVLTHNGTAYDLSSIPDGGMGTPSGDHPFVGSVMRSGSVLIYGIRLGFAAPGVLPKQTRTDWTVTLEDEGFPDLFERPVEEVEI